MHTEATMLQVFGSVNGKRHASGILIDDSEWYEALRLVLRCSGEIDG